jgi:uncharacterized protein
MTTTPSFIYTSSIPVFKQMLGGLSSVLAKAEAHATAKKIDPQALLQSRLYPDMFTLLRQVQVACDFAKSVSARLAGAEVPKTEDNEQSFADLQARITGVLAFIDARHPSGHAERKAFYRAVVFAQLRPAALLLSHHHGL